MICAEDHGSTCSDIRERLRDWYAHHHRKLPWRETHDPYSIWVSEAMLQQTQVSTVVPYYLRFIERFPTVLSLAGASLQDVLKQWEGLGYYGRIRNLHKASQQVRDNFGGAIPQDWASFRKLPGVGDYIAAAVLSIALNQPYAVVDGNVKRVLSRLYLMDAPVNHSNAHATYLEPARMLLDTDSPGLHNQAIMDLGAMVCKPAAPNCDICPVRMFCKAFNSRLTVDYPRRLKRLPVPQHAVAVGVVYRGDGRVLITRRKADGLLGGLWEFPGGKIRDAESAEDACIREIQEETGISVRVQSRLTQVKHAYTHFKIVMDVFICRYVAGSVQLNGPSDYCWATLDELERYPFPGANRKFMNLLKS